MGALSVLIFAPLIGALLIACVPAEFSKAIKILAMSTSIATFFISLGIYSGFQAHEFHFQMLETLNWIPSLGIHYQVGIDGISLWMVMLTTLLSVVAVSFSLYEDRKVKSFMGLLLLLECTMLGTFLSLDMILFYTFFEASLLPMVLLIWIWGDEKRSVAAIRFFIYLFGGSILMLVGMVALAKLNQQTSGHLSFSIIDIQANVANGSLWTGSLALEGMIFWSFAAAFLIKSPVFPFHTWLVDSYTQAPAGAVILGVLVKTGTYGLIRFCLPLFPDALPTATPWIIGLAVVGIIYGAVVAAVQTDMKRLLAFSSVSHVGFIVLGIFSINYTGALGGTFGQINHGVATGSLFLLVSYLYLRRPTRDLRDFGGLKAQMPLFAALFLLSTLAAIGLPGTSAFIGEFFALLGMFQTGFARLDNFTFIPVAFAAAGVILGAVYMLIMFQRLFYGENKNPLNQRLKDIKTWEVGLAAILILFIFWGGFVPSTFTAPMEASVHATQMMGLNDPGHRPSWADPTMAFDNDFDLFSTESNGKVMIAPGGLNPVGYAEVSIAGKGK